MVFLFIILFISIILVWTKKEAAAKWAILIGSILGVLMLLYHATSKLSTVL